ncbi:NADP-dependent oxidoreductase domain-containing protein [Armillaria borealis]|uniref:NADP-dependent oxidoreductase domain-containing protein n=1 Tax=Armillaria borealis TaxID=47425 RepID=A0AA39MX43_9AGAR|nr:NADP-dependent oxidoreductase domain-containing protein [Armillaria borealis]
MAASTTTDTKKMTYMRLGSSRLTISRIILGCMSYGSAEYQPWILPEEEAISHIKAAYDASINTFDAANAYSNGLSEVILGKAIKQFNLPRDAIVIMTKVFVPVMHNLGDQWLPGMDLDGMGYVNQYGLGRKHIFNSVKHSLERLQLDYIDVLQCHRFDNDTPISETHYTLHDVVKAGYVRYIGMSSCFAYQYYAIENKLTPFILMQNHHSLIYLYLLNIYRVEELATKKEISMAQIALAWIMNRDGVSAPIVGTTSLKNLYDLLGAIHVKLTAEEMAYLEEPYKPQAIIGHFWRLDLYGILLDAIALTWL